ncbi:MAG: ATP-binding protein [Candidatus Magnetominusculus sp. LBB02]|nr:ATP-binding protein [Candidatus Magnetominusculus sp. LBB02]
MPNTVVLALTADEAVAASLRAAEMAAAEFKLFTAATATEALSLYRKKKPELVIIDEDEAFTDFLGAIKGSSPADNTPTTLIALTGFNGGQRFYLAGIDLFLRKPINVYELAGIIRHSSELGSLKAIALKHEPLMTLMDNIPDSIYFKDAQSRFVLVNMAKAAHSKTTIKEMIGKTDFDFMPEDEAIAAAAMEKEIMNSGVAIVGNVEKHNRRNGQEVWVSATKIPWKGGDGRILGVIGISRDITDMDKAKRALEAAKNELEKRVEQRTMELTLSNAKLKDEIAQRSLMEEQINRNYQIQRVINSVLEISIEPISMKEQLSHVLSLIMSIPWLSLQSKGSIFLYDEEAEMLVMEAERGLSEHLKEECKNIPAGKCLCGLCAQRREIIFASELDEYHHVRYDGMSDHGHYCVPVMIGRRLLGVINLYVDAGHKRNEMEEAFLRAVADTTAGIIDRNRAEKEKHRLQEQLAQSEKLSALGRLSASVAHEIRNPLAALGGFARRLLKRITEGTKEKEYAEIICSESTRLENILRDILSYSKGAALDLTTHDLNEIIHSSLTNYAEMCSEKSIELQSLLTAIEPIHIDKGQVRQVVDNLISNAIDSIDFRGTIKIATGMVTKDDKEFAFIQVADSGAGIPPDKLKMIFDPFFSTKEMGRGTGLGLSISRKIIEEHGGSISAKSTLGEGAVFSVFLPYQ